MKTCMVGEDAFGKKHFARPELIDEVAAAREPGFPLPTLNPDEDLSLRDTHTDSFATGSSA